MILLSCLCPVQHLRRCRHCKTAHSPRTQSGGVCSSKCLSCCLNFAPAYSTVRIQPPTFASLLQGLSVARQTIWSGTHTETRKLHTAKQRLANVATTLTQHKDRRRIKPQHRLDQHHMGVAHAEARCFELHAPRQAAVLTCSFTASPSIDTISMHQGCMLWLLQQAAAGLPGSSFTFSMRAGCVCV